jgi:hypothetical protein
MMLKKQRRRLPRKATLPMKRKRPPQSQSQRRKK